MCNNCPLHVIVRASLEWREVDNLLRSFGARLPDGLGDRVHDEAVALAHEDLAFSKHLARVLCLVHGAAVDDVAATSIEDLAARTLRPLDVTRDVPFLWGLIVDRRRETTRLAWAWLRGPRRDAPTTRTESSVRSEDLRDLR